MGARRDRSGQKAESVSRRAAEACGAGQNLPATAGGTDIPQTAFLDLPAAAGDLRQLSFWSIINGWSVSIFCILLSN
jgi:hypothetical protein